MPTDQNVAKWQATVTVDLVPVNKYGDELTHLGGAILYKKELKATGLIEIAQVLEKIE